MKQTRAQGRLQSRLLAELGSVVLEHGLKPDHCPVYLPATFDLSGQELEQLEKEHVWHVSYDQGDRLSWDAPIHRVCHFPHVQTQGKHECSEVLLVLNLRDDVVKSDTLIDLEWIEKVRLELRQGLVGVNYEAFRSRSGKLRSVRAEAHVFDANCQLDFALKEVLGSLGSWHVKISGLLVCGRRPNIFIQVRVKLVDLVLHHSTFLDIFRVEFEQHTVE